MASTRISDDVVRVEMDLKRQTFPGRYALDVPGQGARMPYQEDTFARMQTWGANIYDDMFLVNEHLRGTDRTLARKDVFQSIAPAAAVSLAPTFATMQPFTDQSRATDPAWMYRNLEQPSRWQFLHDERNPQNFVEIPFENNRGSRMQEKDDFMVTNNIQHR